jgi:hypothetical protein
MVDKSRQTPLGGHQELSLMDRDAPHPRIENRYLGALP